MIRNTSLFLTYTDLPRLTSFFKKIFQSFLTDQSSIHIWPAWVSSLTALSHLALAVNSSTNLLLYCFCDKHFWVLAQKRFKSGVVWPFVMRDKVIYKFEWLRTLKRSFNCSSSNSSTTSSVRGSQVCRCDVSRRRRSSCDVYCSCDAYDAQTANGPAFYGSTLKCYRSRGLPRKVGHDHCGKEVVVTVEVDNDTDLGRGSVSRVTEVTEL